MKTNYLKPLLCSTLLATAVLCAPLRAEETDPSIELNFDVLDSLRPKPTPFKPFAVTPPSKPMPLLKVPAEPKKKAPRKYKAPKPKAPAVKQAPVIEPEISFPSPTEMQAPPVIMEKPETPKRAEKHTTPKPPSVMMPEPEALPPVAVPATPPVVTTPPVGVTPPAAPMEEAPKVALPAPYEAPKESFSAKIDRWINKIRIMLGMGPKMPAPAAPGSALAPKLDDLAKPAEPATSVPPQPVVPPILPPEESKPSELPMPIPAPVEPKKLEEKKTEPLPVPVMPEVKKPEPAPAADLKKLEEEKPVPLPMPVMPEVKKAEPKLVMPDVKKIEEKKPAPMPSLTPPPGVSTAIPELPAPVMPKLPEPEKPAAAKAMPKLPEAPPAAPKKAESPAIPSLPEAPVAKAGKIDDLALLPNSLPDAPPAPAPIVAADPTQDSLYTVLFTTGDDTVPEPDAAQLGGVASQMKAQKDLRLSIIGYAPQAEGDQGDARRLSLKRALAVRKLLIDKGVDSNRVNVQAMGDKTDNEVKDRVDVLKLN